MPTSLRSSSSPWLAVLVVCLAQFMTILASGIFNSAQNIGGALGIAILSTVANATTGGSTAPDALVDGYTAAFAVAAGMLIAAGVAAALLLRGEDVALPDGEEARATAVA